MRVECVLPSSLERIQLVADSLLLEMTASLAATTLPAGLPVSSAILSATTSNPSALSGIIVQGWTAEPSTRGTWSLLYSCVFTIGLCIWTALHLNVPSAKDGRWIVFFRKVGWMGYAFIAPEFVFGIASRQLYNAWQLRQALLKNDKRHNPIEEIPPETSSSTKAEPNEETGELKTVGSLARLRDTVKIEAGPPTEPSRTALPQGASVHVITTHPKVIPRNKSTNLATEADAQSHSNVDFVGETLQHQTAVEAKQRTLQPEEEGNTPNGQLQGRTAVQTEAEGIVVESALHKQTTRAHSDLTKDSPPKTEAKVSAFNEGQLSRRKVPSTHVKPNSDIGNSVRALQHDLLLLRNHGWLHR